MSTYKTIFLVFFSTAACFLSLFSIPHSSYGKAYFEDGFLGLTQTELHQKLGNPHAVRARKAALRIFHYYKFQDWEKYFKKLMSPENGEDVYTYERDGIQVRYSFLYTPDLREDHDFPTLYVQRVEVEFTPAIPMENIPTLVPEFRPAHSSKAPAFKSNLWILLFKGSPSKRAELIIKEPNKETLDWHLSYQMFSLEGIPDYLTLHVPIERLELTTQSLQVVKHSQRHTHEPILNPFSREFAQRPPQPTQKPKSIPHPHYAD
ncbi:MAG: hypothetical protein GKS05_07645 [Nitrospirales bacterium]|nr:hypothetical protein [Nitrospirales bacterium]